MKFGAVLLVLLAQLAQSAAGVVGFLVIARITGPVLLADYIVGVAVAGIFGCFMQNALREPIVLAKESDTSFFYSVSILVSSASATVCASVGLILQLCLSERLVGYVVAILAGKMWIDGLCVVPYAMRAKDRLFVMPAVASIAAALASIGALIVLARDNTSVIILPISQVFGSVVLLFIYFLKDGYGFSLNFSSLFEHPSRYIKNWLRISGWQIIEYANGMFDRLFAARAMPQVEQGVYGFSRRLNDLFFEVTGGTVATITLPVLAAQSGDRAALRDTYFALIQAVGVLLLGIVGGLFCLSDYFIVDIFGVKWAEAVPIYKAFLLMAVLQTYGYLQSSLIRALSENALWTRYIALQAIGNVVAVMIFARWGAVALATAVVAKTYLVWGFLLKPIADLVQATVWQYLQVLIRPLIAAALPVVCAKVLMAKLFPFAGPYLYVSALTVYAALWVVAVAIFCRPAVTTIIRFCRRAKAVVQAGCCVKGKNLLINWCNVSSAQSIWLACT